MLSKKLFIILSALLILSLPATVFAKLGVGVNIGKIQVDEAFKPGGIYKLPPLSVINTGDEKTDYAVEITYHQDQPELRPDQKWFSFNPQKFSLEPGQSQEVNITVNLPMMAKPGDYFVYLEGHPVKEEGQVTIGIAAATKLYFKIVPSSWWQALYHKIVTFFTVYAPISYIVLGILVLIIIIAIFNKYFHFKFALKVEKKR